MCKYFYIKIFITFVLSKNIIPMKHILGLDLGSNSIGWAFVQQDFENKQGEKQRSKNYKYFKYRFSIIILKFSIKTYV